MKINSPSVIQLLDQIYSSRPAWRLRGNKPSVIRFAYEQGLWTEYRDIGVSLTPKGREVMFVARPPAISDPIPDVPVGGRKQMTTREKSLLGSAHGNILGCLDTLHRRASDGVRAKPTVKELNDILARLIAAKKAIEEAVSP